MEPITFANWKNKVVLPEQVLEKISPGMSIFISTGVSEPRTLVKHLMKSDAGNLQDLELIQVLSLGDAISLKELKQHKYRLKTFFSGWIANDAIMAGRVDLIPCRYSQIPKLLEARSFPIDVVFVQITPPNESGYCSFGASVDVARIAMNRASFVVGEINPLVPVTFGDTFVHISDFDMIVESDAPMIYFNRWPKDDVFDKVAYNVASLIEDGSCIVFSIGPLFDALSKHLTHKRDLGIQSPIFTDALMEVIQSGAVTNRRKYFYPGKSLCCYALGTPELMKWLHRNPLVEFQGIDQVFNPNRIGMNPNIVAIIHARKIDLSGRIALHTGKGNIASGPAEVIDYFSGANISEGGFAVFALPSRNLKGESNIMISVEKFPNRFSMRESIEIIVTEYGIAHLRGKSIRERAQALIDIAHPEDRESLVKKAKREKILYEDQIYIAESAHFYPESIATMQGFKNNLKVRFRAIKPSDEEGMRRLFYRFSDEAVYYRYFTPVKTMPHSKMQEYVNINYKQVMSIIGILDDQDLIIAEARYIKHPDKPFADIAFVVDEEYNGSGIATFMFKKLIQIAKDAGLKGFTADVLSSNIGMMRVFEKGGLTIKSKLEYGAYELTIPFDTNTDAFHYQYPKQ
ncbi:MAG: GNAT family N-acetyltransferase [Proteobacteria bacterium]|nr:GNAT family N-acetyltransferase [Pseudomonadota bacterium]